MQGQFSQFLNPMRRGMLPYDDQEETPNAPMVSRPIAQRPMAQPQAQEEPWMNALRSGMQGASRGGLVGAGAQIGKDMLLKHFASSGVAKALLSFL